MTLVRVMRQQGGPGVALVSQKTRLAQNMLIFQLHICAENHTYIILNALRTDR